MECGVLFLHHSPAPPPLNLPLFLPLGCLCVGFFVLFFNPFCLRRLNLNWLGLQARRKSVRLSVMYKITLICVHTAKICLKALQRQLHHLPDLSSLMLVHTAKTIMSETSSTPTATPSKSQPPGLTTGCSPATIVDWNVLPEVAVTAPGVDILKVRVDALPI